MTLKPYAGPAPGSPPARVGWPAKCTGTSTFGSRPPFARAVELLRERRNAHVPGERIDVDEIDVRAAVARAVRRRDERIGHGPERGRPGRGPSARQAMCSADVALLTATACAAPHTRGDGALEARDGRPLREEVRAQDLDDRVDVGLRDVLAAVRNHSDRPHDGSTRRSPRSDRKCGFLPEWYSKPCSTGRPRSPQLVDREIGTSARTGSSA